MVENITERLSLYTKLDNCMSEKRIAGIPANDRPLWPHTSTRGQIYLQNGTLIRKKAVDLGFLLLLKNENLKCFFVKQSRQSVFYQRHI